MDKLDSVKWLPADIEVIDEIKKAIENIDSQN